MLFAFGKYSGCGNDFIIIDDRTLVFPSDDKEQIKRLCHRPQGVGADGLILLQKSPVADFSMRIFNADGSEADMCGNGIRTLMRFIHDLGFAHQVCTIASLAGILTVYMAGQQVAVKMSPPKNIQWNSQVDVQGQNFEVHFLDTGVPHVVHFTDKLESFDMASIGRKFRYHTNFAPQGTNFNVAHIAGNKVSIRTYERGVEAETLACGTGSVAAALAAHRCYGLPSPITVVTRSQEELEISFEAHEHGFDNVCMAGPAVKIFEGSIFVSTAEKQQKMAHPGFSGLQLAQCN